MARPIPDLEPMTASEAAVDDVVIIDDTSDAETKKMSVDQLLKLIIPTGLIAPFGGPNAPDGFLLCDGAAVSRTTYADLFAVVGESYGIGDGSNTFNLPNLKGRVPVGLDTSQSEFDTLGKSGGDKRMQNHTHTGTTNTDGSHAHNAGNNIMYRPNSGGTVGWTSGSTMISLSPTSQGSNHSHNFTTNSTGSGNSQNLQPYQVTCFVIKF